MAILMAQAPIEKCVFRAMAARPCTHDGEHNKVSVADSVSACHLRQGGWGTGSARQPYARCKFQRAAATTLLGRGGLDLRFVLLLGEGEHCNAAENCQTA